jgi:hypothetical protein
MFKNLDEYKSSGIVLIFRIKILVNVKNELKKTYSLIRI